MEGIAKTCCEVDGRLLSANQICYILVYIVVTFLCDIELNSKRRFYFRIWLTKSNLFNGNSAKVEKCYIKYLPTFQSIESIN